MKVFVQKLLNKLLITPYNQVPIIKLAVYRQGPHCSAEQFNKKQALVADYIVQKCILQYLNKNYKELTESSRQRTTQQGQNGTHFYAVYTQKTDYSREKSENNQGVRGRQTGSKTSTQPSKDKLKTK